MPVGSLSAAKHVCEVRGWSISNLEIHKLLYLAHMLSLGRSGGASGLVAEHFQAWDYGPVLPRVYHRAKAYGSGPVQNVFHYFPDIAGTPEAAIIEEVCQKMGDKTPAQLVAITHANSGAWAKHYRPGQHDIVIPNQDILEEYRSRVRS